MKTKLNDLSIQQFLMWKAANCNKECLTCLFQYVNCGKDSTNQIIWVNCKRQFSEDFLNTNIEITEILTEEKDYLSKVIKPFRDRIISISKSRTPNNLFDNIRINYYLTNSNNDGIMSLPDFNANSKFIDMKPYKSYTLEELGL